MEKNTSVIEMFIDTKLQDLIDNVLEELGKVDPCDEDTITSVKNLKRESAQYGFTLKLVGALQKYYNVNDGAAWVKGLNGNDDVLGFEDCVYDCIQHEFREGRPEDMVTFSTGHTRKEVEESDPLIGKRVMDAIENIHGSKEVFEFVIKVISTVC